jgi:hypothetical protein
MNNMTDKMKLTKKQLVILLDGFENRLSQANYSAGRLRSDIYKMDIDSEIKSQIISRIDKHMDELI